MWGGKLTGKSGRNFAGVFVTRDESNSLMFPSSQGSASALLEDDVTASVLRYRRDLGQGSTLGVLYTGREAEGYHNRVGGLDGFFRLSNTDEVTFQYLWSDTGYQNAVAAAYDQPTGTFGAGDFSAFYQHGSRNWNWAAGYDEYGRDFRADSGFVPQVDIRNLGGTITRVFWGARDDWYTQANVGGAATRTDDHSGQLIEQTIRVNGAVQARMQTRSTSPPSWSSPPSASRSWRPSPSRWGSDHEPKHCRREHDQLPVDGFLDAAASNGILGWFVGDGLVQAIDACLKPAREAGCKLNVKKIEVIATRRQRGEV